MFVEVLIGAWIFPVLIIPHVQTVPTDCVTIKSLATGSYLELDDSFDDLRTHVTLGGLDLWNILPAEDDQERWFRIQHIEPYQDLYAASEQYEYSFTWANGVSVRHGYWDITELETVVGNGTRFLIRNTFYNEYLCAAHERVFAWRKHANIDDSSFVWEIQSCDQEQFL
uniref:Putative conserved secreted protein n=1 Tax=Culex tarsalis TaxID=7177 RepID=A0A1Q3FQ43_CULTA